MPNLHTTRQLRPTRLLPALFGQGLPLTLPLANLAKETAKETLPHVQGAQVLRQHGETFCSKPTSPDGPSLHKAQTQHVLSCIRVLSRLAPLVLRDKRTCSCLVMFCRACARRAHTNLSWHANHLPSSQMTLHVGLQWWHAVQLVQSCKAKTTLGQSRKVTATSQKVKAARPSP